MIKYDSPRQVVMGVDDLSEELASFVALKAVEAARSFMPKVTGAAAATLTPIWGEGWFGIEWTHDSVWFMEAGTRPHTMRNIAGKTIPMWLNDPDGELRSKNPKAKTRVTGDGRQQTLVFRRAAKIGDRKQVWRNEGGVMRLVSVPASYPGAPGQIGRAHV